MKGLSFKKGLSTKGVIQQILEHRVLSVTSSYFQADIFSRVASIEEALMHFALREEDTDMSESQ